MKGRIRLTQRHMIYLLIFVATSIPILKPIGIPLTVTPPVQTVYDFVGKLPEGTPVVISFDVTPAGYGETGPAAKALMRHILQRGLKIVAVSFCDTGAPIFESSIADIGLPEKQYGVDYVNLGYRAGEETALAAFATDIHKLFPSDYRGNDISSLPMMENIKTIKDVGLIVVVFSTQPGTQTWIRQVADPNKIPITTVATNNNIAALAPYVQSKQLIGIIGGLRGGAEYETLIKRPAVGVAGMDAQSVTHVTVCLLVILGNVIFFTGSRKKRGASA